MRIGISTSVIQRGRSGIGQYLLALIRALHPFADKHQFFIFVLREDMGLFEFAAERMRLVPVDETCRQPASDILWHQRQLPVLARTLNLDVLHVPSYRRLLWPRPCGLVGTIHDLAPFHLKGKYDWKRMFYGKVIARILALRQDRVVAVSRTTAKDVVRFFRVPEQRISVIYNGIDHLRFHPRSGSEARLRVADRLGLMTPFFLYVARLEHPGKNHVRLIKAFENFKMRTGSNWELVFGGADWHGAELIHRAVKDSPFASDIRSLGFVSEDELPDLYRAASAFVYPSLYEGFGMPPVEAMACGTPVICSGRGALAEVVGDAAFLVDPEDTESIASEMARLADNPEAGKSAVIRGFQNAERFNWSFTAQATIAVYSAAASDCFKRAGVRTQHIDQPQRGPAKPVSRTG